MKLIKKIVLLCLVIAIAFGNCIMSFSESNDTMSNAAVKSGMVQYYTIDPMVGKAKDYTTDVKVKKGNVVADDAIANLGITAFGSLISGALPVLGPWVARAGWAKNLYDVYTAKKIDDKKLYYTVTIKAHKDNGKNGSHTYAFQHTYQFTSKDGKTKYGTPTVSYYTYII